MLPKNFSYFKSIKTASRSIISAARFIDSLYLIFSETMTYSSTLFEKYPESLIVKIFKYNIFLTTDPEILKM